MPENNDLSERELEILELVATGASNKEIARQLYISSNTVKVHLRNIFTKIGANSRTEAAMFALQQGLIESPGLDGSQGETLEANAEQAQERISTISFPLSMRSGFFLAVLLVVVIAVTIGLASLATRTNTPAVSTSLTPPTSSSRWVTHSPLSSPRYGMAITVFDGEIYVMGGTTTSGITGLVETYSPETDQWTSRAGKPTAVTDAAAAVIGGNIYVPGGRLPSGDVTTALDIYDPVLDSWEQGAPLPNPVSAYALAPYEGNLYLFGGWDGEEYLASTYRYDPGQDRWFDMPAMPTPRAFLGAVVSRSEIYVLGGKDQAGALSVNEVFHPQELEQQGSPWSEAAPMPSGRYAMGMANVADFIHILGGEGSGDEGVSTLKYTPSTDMWEQVGDAFSTPITHEGLVMLDTHLYIVGGLEANQATGQVRSYQAIFTIAIPYLR